MIEPVDVIRIGDRIWFSVELIEQFQADPHSRSGLVIVESIERNTDGTLIVSLVNAL